MNKKGITLILIGIISLTTIFFAFRQPKQEIVTEYLRIHVRANSNEQADQMVKYEIKDKLVLFLTPYISSCNSKEQAINTINSLTGKMDDIANACLLKKGFNYKAKTCIRQEYFPTRVYDGESLPSGVYDSIIVELGKADGNNWWCVVYPPLCFVNSATPVKYKSKIVEIIRRFKKNGK